MTARLRCEVFPADLDRAVDFYVRVLGFTLLRDERDSNSPYVYMGLGDVRIGAVPAWAPLPSGDVRIPPVGVELVLEVDDLDEQCGRVVAAGWPLAQGITTRPWGLRDFRLVDPDGYYWRITSH